MGYRAQELFTQSFTSVDELLIEHNLDIEYPAVRVLVGDDVRPDLLESVIVSNSDPTNILVVKLTSTQTGFIQILNYDFQAAGILSTTTLVGLGLGGNFLDGFEYNYTESLSPQSTMSTSYIQRLRLSVINLPAATYRVSTSFTWNYSGNSNNFSARLQSDDTTDLWDMTAEPKSSNTSQEYFAQGNSTIVLTSGNHDIDLDYLSSAGSKTSRISQARIELWRIV